MCSTKQLQQNQQNSVSCDPGVYTTQVSSYQLESPLMRTPCASHQPLFTNNNSQYLQQFSTCISQCIPHIIPLNLHSPCTLSVSTYMLTLISSAVCISWFNFTSLYIHMSSTDTHPAWSISFLLM